MIQLSSSPSPTIQRAENRIIRPLPLIRCKDVPLLWIEHMGVLLKVKIPVPLILTCPSLLDSSGAVILVFTVRNEGRRVVANVILVVSKDKVKDCCSEVVEEVLNFFEGLCKHDVELNVHTMALHFVACPGKRECALYRYRWEVLVNVVKERVNMVQYWSMMSLSHFKFNISLPFYFNLLFFDLQLPPFVFKQILVTLDFLFKNVHDVKIMGSYSPSHISCSSSIVVWDPSSGCPDDKFIPHPDL